MFEQAQLVAERAICPTRPAGAVLLTTSGIEFHGYEGAPHGVVHCDAVGCRVVDNICHHAMPAELNAVIRCARATASSVGAVLVVSAPLHPSVVGVVINAGIAKVVCAAPVAQPVQSSLALAQIELELVHETT